VRTDEEQLRPRPEIPDGLSIVVKDES